MSRVHRTSAFVFVFLAALAAGGSILAWVQINLIDLGFPDAGLHVQNGTSTFLLEQDGSSQINNGSDVAAIRSSYQRINGIATSDAEIIDGGEFDFPDPVDVSDGFGDGDGENRIFFFQEDVNDEFGGGIAAAIFFFIPSTGRITECDIAFSDIAGVTWSTNDHLPPGRIDVEGVANQEIMHCFGLEHSPIAGRFDASTGLQVDGFLSGDFSLQSSLFPFAARTTETRTLEPDDIAAFSTVYPNAEADASFGTISGQVLAPDGTTGVKGAHVVAVPANDPTLPVVGALSGLGSEPGGYRLTGLEPGDYFVRVEPLLGTSNIFTEEDTFFSGFETGFPPEFYSGAAESDTDLEIGSGDAAPVTVTAGVEEPLIDVVLNNVTPPPPNDDFANATLISQTPFTDSEGISAATTEDSDPTPTCANGSRAKSVWYSFVSSAGGTVRADTFGSDYDTILSVWTGAGAPSTEVACNDDIVLGQEVQSEVSFSATAGTPYYFMVTSFSGSGGNLVFHLEEMAFDFSITASPSSITISAGGTAVYTLTLIPQGGFTGEVSLSCLGAPLAATCQASPSAVPLNGVDEDEDEGTATLTVTTTAGSLLLPAPGSDFPIHGIPWLLMGVFLVGLAEWAHRKMPGRAVSPRGVGWGIATILLFSILWASCGEKPVPGTPLGIYTLTIAGTVGTISKGTTVTLIVN
ncbi:MAG: carboxypeptidase-like regulatory domain-containing protein [Acidobacteria bacterium]|nr:carboxypeptidase-like regulatory domain-containing protein [Acidobacteriota bacterium]